MIDIGIQIKQLRTARNLTQSELAERINVTKSTVSAYENNTRLPSYDVLIKIAELFKVSVDNILGYSNKYVIDVTGLADKQRNTIQDIVNTYKQHNKFLYDNFKDDSIEDALVEMGLIKKEL